MNVKTIMLFLLMLFMCGELFQPTTCPDIRTGCGLAGQERPVTRRHQMTKYKNFRRRDIDPKFPWKVLDPGQLRKLVPTSSTARIYWNLTNERCDYLRLRCMQAYLTGAVCARTILYQYMSFESYCAMTWHNCIQKYDNIWSIAYMGFCVEVDMDKDLYVDMSYEQMANNSKLQSMYVAGSADMTDFKAYASIATRKTALTTSRQPAPTHQVIVKNVTDKNGTVVTDKEGHIVTVTEVITVPYENVTDASGKVMTDDYGDYITITESTSTISTKATTAAAHESTTNTASTHAGGISTTKKSKRDWDYY